MIKHSALSLAWVLLATNAIADELVEQGKKVFMELAQPSCTICHTLSDAGSAGEIGPNLDELAPSETQVQNAVKGGVGLMPAFSDSLSEEQIRAVAHYVASVAGNSP
ncbi:c-type cytochrome [Marinobacter sp. F4218]|uniref:SorU family sulfite dehydrogenase c-type cytochrome subunit n=1 Tax=Marinobacter sp. F4218 TaxID=2862868 RepID=UPI001C638CF9|nr:cytochrome c [Marinobacter sp. F4218]MBW7471187.1 cytochrome c [Marinobacter sp. F4218]